MTDLGFYQLNKDEIKALAYIKYLQTKGFSNPYVESKAYEKYGSSVGLSFINNYI